MGWGAEAMPILTVVHVINMTGCRDTTRHKTKVVGDTHVRHRKECR